MKIIYKQIWVLDIKSQNHILAYTISIVVSLVLGLNKEGQDFLEELRLRSGKRSQTTRRLIRKIHNESVKSKISLNQGKYNSYFSLDFFDKCT